MQNDAVKLAFDHFLMVAELTREMEKNNDWSSNLQNM
jgi:hypothetical protein